jgi:hypothetical protein
MHLTSCIHGDHVYLAISIILLELLKGLERALLRRENTSRASHAHHRVALAVQCTGTTSNIQPKCT